MAEYCTHSTAGALVHVPAGGLIIAADNRHAGANSFSPSEVPARLCARHQTRVKKHAEVRTWRLVDHEPCACILRDERQNDNIITENLRNISWQDT